MTNTEIKKALTDVKQLVNRMDKSHAKNLLKILIDAQNKKNCASFFAVDIRKSVKKLLTDLIKSDHVNNYLNRKQMKQIFTIMGDYHFYPVCKLCGQPIKIDTYSLQHENQGQHMAFSWDHIKPKSIGGSYDLANMQPTHKICNNKRGIKPVYRKIASKHYEIRIDVSIDFESENPRYRPNRFGLRKQDSWCHKQCCQYHR